MTNQKPCQRITIWKTNSRSRMTKKNPRICRGYIEVDIIPTQKLHSTALTKQRRPGDTLSKFRHSRKHNFSQTNHEHALTKGPAEYLSALKTPTEVSVQSSAHQCWNKRGIYQSDLKKDQNCSHYTAPWWEIHIFTASSTSLTLIRR